MAKLVAVQLETCHANQDSTAWYAYFEAEGTFDLSKFRTKIKDASKKDGAPVGVEMADDPEEAPNALSRHTGLRRFYVGLAV